LSTRIDTRLGRFGWGCAGGLILYVGRISIAALSGAIAMDAPFPKIGLAYVLAILCTVLLSGVVAYALESSHVFMALYNGASTPAVIMFLLHAAGTPGSFP
jgi:hypothetical protein